jgi:hypothetical protein
MKLWKRLLIVKLCIRLALMPILFAFQSASIAQTTAAADAAYWNMNRALSGVTQQALESRGYVANDPRTYNTLRSMSTTAGTIVGGTAAATVGAVTLAGITAPAWGTIVLVAAVSTVVGIGVQMAVSGIINWLFRSDKKIDIGSAAQPYSLCALGDTYEYWDAVLNGATIYACDGQGLALQVLHTKFPTGNGQNGQTTCANSVTVISCTNVNGGANAFRRTGTLSKTCPPSHYLNGTQCIGFTYPLIPAVPNAANQSLQQAVSALPQSELSKPLNPQLVAATANALWQQAAAQLGYAGIPYPSANPISTAEATAWRTANPTTWPTVGQFVAPRPTTTAQPEPWALPTNPSVVTATPTLATAPNPNVINPSTQPQQNLGEDPATPAPQLEKIPTAQEILDPILNLLPGHKGFSAPSVQGQCPTPTIELYGSHTMNAHCTLIEQNKSIIQAAMTFAWAAIALFIILSA